MIVRQAFNPRFWPVPILVVALTTVAHTQPRDPAHPWPFDQAEAIRRQRAEAARLGIPALKIVPLSATVQMKFVLIPTGTFRIGQGGERLSPGDAWLAMGMAAIGVLSVVGFGVFVLTRASREKRRPCFSLRLLLVTTITGGLGLSGIVKLAQQKSANTRLLRREFAAHTVQIVRPYYMAVTETTQDQWSTLMGPQPSVYGGPARPVDSVSMHNAKDYAKAFSKWTGTRARVPVETEWEYACRAGSDGDYAFGNSRQMLGIHAWHTSNSKKTSHPVAKKRQRLGTPRHARQCEGVVRIHPPWTRRPSRRILVVGRMPRARS
jgi:formylglycine-generating enzyme required for sulfatase activity